MRCFNCNMLCRFAEFVCFLHVVYFLLCSFCVLLFTILLILYIRCKKCVVDNEVVFLCDVIKS
jgi:hypothetical protein